MTAFCTKSQKITSRSFGVNKLLIFSHNLTTYLFPVTIVLDSSGFRFVFIEDGLKKVILWSDDFVVHKLFAENNNIFLITLICNKKLSLRIRRIKMKNTYQNAEEESVFGKGEITFCNFLFNQHTLELCKRYFKTNNLLGRINHHNYTSATCDRKFWR